MVPFEILVNYHFAQKTNSLTSVSTKNKDLNFLQEFYHSIVNNPRIIYKTNALELFKICRQIELKKFSKQAYPETISCLYYILDIFIISYDLRLLNTGIKGFDLICETFHKKDRLCKQFGNDIHTIIRLLNQA
jgi:hypothetical protein